MDDLLPEELKSWAEHLERLQWSALILDEDWRMSWVSSQLQEFLGADETSDLGYGLHIVEAILKPQWINTVHQDSQVEMFFDLAPFFMKDFRRRNRDPADVLPEQFLPLLEQVEESESLPYFWSSSFQFVDPQADRNLPMYRVNLCFIRLHDSSGAMLGWLVIFFLGVRPNLLSLLARGNEAMYERMAALVEPSPHQAAILFCDLHASGRLSRELSSSAYFKLVRRLWTGIDTVIARNTGIVGKHAGDGASAFFLTDDMGSPSETAAAAVRAAREIHDVSQEVFDSYDERACEMKVGVHWGANLYMGQLVPGSRLDVTALGDEINEAARIQNSAEPNQTLASKQLIEQLTDDDAAKLGIDVEKTRFTPLAELGHASEKAMRDAGAIAVTPVD